MSLFGEIRLDLLHMRCASPEAEPVVVSAPGKTENSDPVTHARQRARDASGSHVTAHVDREDPQAAENQNRLALRERCNHRKNPSTGKDLRGATCSSAPS